jgi:hypothetical protein
MLIKGAARLIEPHLVEIAMGAGTERYYADSMVTASGADVGVLPIRSPEYCLTSRDIYAVNPHLVHLPRRMAIRGAGYVGPETACVLIIFGVKIAAVVTPLGVAGILLVMALLAIPAALSRRLTFSVPKMMALSCLFSALSTMSGLFISLRFQLPSGAVIAILCGVVFIVFLIVSRLRDRKRQNG